MTFRLRYGPCDIIEISCNFFAFQGEWILPRRPAWLPRALQPLTLASLPERAISWFCVVALLFQLQLLQLRVADPPTSS